MSQAARRLFLLVFAFLQCLAPLLHAHASAEPHSGVHLPEWTQPLAGKPGAQQGWQQETTSHVEAVVIGEARGLAAFETAEPKAVAGAVGDLPGFDAPGLARLPAPPPAIPHPDPSWLHPALRAPPRA